MQIILSRIRSIKPVLTLLYLSSMGFLCILSVQKYLGQSFDPLHCLSFMGIIFGVYTLNRFTDTAEDFTNDIGRLLFFQRKRIFLALAIGALVGSFGYLGIQHKLNWMHFLLLSMGFTYSYRIIPWYIRGEGWQFFRIKEMTFLKNISVSFLWGASVFVLPILYTTKTDYNHFTIWMLGLGLFLSTLNNTLFDDILDVDGDKIAGIKTLPTTWGIRKSKYFLIGLNCLWLVMILYFYGLGKLNGAHTTFLAFMALYPFLYMSLHWKNKISKSWIDFISETDLLLFGVGMLALSII